MPFRDITIYYSDRKTLDFDSLNNPNHFRQTVNFICDFYHQLLNGYKPSKTSRLCIHFTNRFSDILDKPSYFGSICSAWCYFEEEKFSEVSVKVGLKYVLDLLHTSVITVADLMGWEKSVFQNAYQDIINADFFFQKVYPSKSNRIKSHVGRVILEKDIFTSKIYFAVSDNTKTVKELALVRDNAGCLDSSYSTCKRVKWLNKTSYGLEFKTNTTQKAYYSTELNKMCFEGF